MALTACPDCNKVRPCSERKVSMGCLGNLLWFLFGGCISGLSWCLADLLWCITIIGMPFGSEII